MANNLKLAPPPRIVDGLFAVPIDIQALEADVIFDLSTKTVTVEAQMNFRMGANAGNPIFDLRQSIQQAFLNGISFPIVQLTHHDFGGGTDAELRIIEQVLPANSSNILRLLYELDQPAAPHTVPIDWDASNPHVRWDFYMSDLYPGRYLEMWFPSNLIYDQFSFTLNLNLINTSTTHEVITNGTVSVLGTNSWQITFPGNFTTLSHLLLVLPSSEVLSQQSTLTLPGGGTINIHTNKSAGSTTNLAAAHSNVEGFILNNVNNIGSYAHGGRFTTFIWKNAEPRSGMEYDGGTTTKTSALEHEVFHSWHGRGVKPGTQNDSWYDEAWTTYNTAPNRFSLEPFNLADPPVTLSSLNNYKRNTPRAAYSDGFSFFAGLAVALGLNNLRSYMSEFYQENIGQLLTTAELEAYLICQSGTVGIADYFERFVYGFGDLIPGVHPDLYIRDASDDPGADHYTGSRFWDSPDLWIRNFEDGGTAHQNPEAGQDNWFYARIRNRGTATARTFVVTFNVKPFAGTQFIYPGDFLPCINTVVGFNLAPGASTIVKAKWPTGLVPSAGTHTCLLASVYTPTDVSPIGRHVWEHNNLAQKNLTIVDLLPDDTVTIPFQIGNALLTHLQPFRLEVRRPQNWRRLPVSIVHRDPEVINRLFRSIEEIRIEPIVTPVVPTPVVRFADPTRMEIRHRSLSIDPVRLNLAPDSTLDIGTESVEAQRIGDAFLEQRQEADLVTDRTGTTSIVMRPGLLTGFPIALRPRSQIKLGVKVAVPPEAKPGDVLLVDLVQRNRENQVVGGISVQINVRQPLLSNAQ